MRRREGATDEDNLYSEQVCLRLLTKQSSLAIFNERDRVVIVQYYCMIM